MFELVIAALVLGVSFFLEGKLMVFLLGLGLLLILPGFYAMVTGAPYVKTSRKKIEIMIKLADLKKSDNVVDLGCGDGGLVRAAAAKGVKSAVGYELSLPTYLWAKTKSLIFGRGEKIVFANFWKQDFSNVNVIFCFLLRDSMNEFELRILPKLSKGTRVVSHIFTMKNVKPAKSLESVHLYVKKN